VTDLSRWRAPISANQGRGLCKENHNIDQTVILTLSSFTLNGLQFTEDSLWQSINISRHVPLIMLILAIAPPLLSQETTPQSSTQPPVPGAVSTPAQNEPAPAPQIQTQNHETVDLQNQLIDAQQDREALKSQLRETRQKLAQTRQQSESFVNQLEALRQEGYGALPSNFSSAKPVWLTDSTAVIEATLNRGGIVSAKLYSLAGGSRSPQLESHVSDYQATHRFKFSDLSPKSDYEVELVVLNFSNKETTVRANATTHPSDLKFRTHETPSAPIISATQVPVADHVDVVLTTNEDVLLRVSCMRHYHDKATPIESSVEGNDLARDDSGIPHGGIRLIKDEPHHLIFKTEPGSEYSIQWTGYAASTGKEVPKPINDFSKFSTPALPIPLAFKGSFGLTVSPTKVDLNWAATRKPNSARVEVKVSDTEYRVIQSIGENISENSITVSVDAASLAQLKQGKDALQLKAIMEVEGQDPVMAEFKISVRLNPEEKGLSPDQREGVSKVAEAAAKGRGKIDWREIAKTGLPLIVSFL
jgi:hypothetical protein